MIGKLGAVDKVKSLQVSLEDERKANKKKEKAAKQ